MNSNTVLILVHAQKFYRWEDEPKTSCDFKELEIEFREYLYAPSTKSADNV